MPWQNCAMSVPFARARGRRAKVDVTVTRNSIVDSAREVFACYGFGAATYERIGRRIGLSRVAVSNHFPDKQDLYREVVECADARLAAVVSATAPEQHHVSGPAGLAAFLTAVFADGDHRSSVAFWLTSAVDAHRDNQLPAVDRSVVQARVTALVDDAVARGDLDARGDVASLVALLTALFWGMCFSSLTVGHDRDLLAGQARRLVSGNLLAGRR